jgi:hypothetical protein
VPELASRYEAGKEAGMVALRRHPNEIAPETGEKIIKKLETEKPWLGALSGLSVTRQGTVLSGLTLLAQTFLLISGRSARPASLASRKPAMS